MLSSILGKPGHQTLSDLSELLNPMTLQLETGSSLRQLVSTPVRYGEDCNLVIEFNREGKSKYKEIKRAELLQITRAAADDADLHAVELLGTTPVLRCRTGFSSARQAFRGVHMRDLRMFYSAFTMSNEPSILVRKQAILVNTDPIRAVILRHSCYVFVLQSSDSLIATLKDAIYERINDKEALPFEFCALDAVFCSLYTHLDEKLEQMTPELQKALTYLVNAHFNSGQMETLRNIKNTVKEFHLQVCGIRRAIMELLDHDEDMRLLYLTKLYHNPDLFEKLPEQDADHAEALLETYLLDVHTTRTRVEILQNQIQNTESLVMLKLDSTRNQLLTVDVLFALLSMFMSLGMFVTSFFGMNLRSGLEDTPRLFWYVLAGTAVISGIISLVLLFYFRRRGLILT